MKATYDEYGYLNGDKIRNYNNTIKWNRFQKHWLAQHKGELKKQTVKNFSHDEGLRFYQVVDNERILLSDNISTQLYGDRMILTNGSDYTITFNWDSISKMGMFRNNRLYFTYDDKRYQLERPSGFPLIKYFSLWRVLTDKALV